VALDDALIEEIQAADVMPLGEPIAQYGPFVMNTNDEIFQAVRDYQSGKFAAST
jgi:redox-sensitive bicupin YhaK (pirin superfamily)